MLRNLGWAAVLQLALLLSGTLSARMLGPANRGYLAILSSCGTAVGQIGAVGVSLAATYYLAAGRAGGKEIVELLRGAAAIQIMTLTAAYATIVFGYVLISGAPILLSAAVFALFLLPAGLAMDYGVALALGGRRYGLAAGVRAVGPILYALGYLYLFLSGNGTLNSVSIVFMTGTALGSGVALVWGVRAAYRVVTKASVVAIAGRAKARRDVLAFGRRGYVGYLAPTDTFRLDQIMLGFLLAPRVVGIYAIGAAFTNFTRLVAFNIGMSGTSEVAKGSNRDAQRATIQHTLVVTGVVLTVVSVLVGLALVPIIPLLFGQSYQGSVPIAECLLVATWFLAMKRVSVDLMRGAGETRIGTRAEVINLLLFLAIGPVAAFSAGGVGVALCLAASAAAGLLYLVAQMRRMHFIRWFGAAV